MKRLGLTAIAGTTTLLAGLLYPNDSWANGITPAIDGTGTQVMQSGSDHAITGGTSSADNQNLFHSFSEFNLLTGESATFIANPAIQNILSRITGGNPSLIDGLLQVSGADANLFLINPSGILFGPNAALNLQGSFTAVTADQVNFATGVFGTVGTPDYTALVGNPDSFSFTAAVPGSVVNGGNLRVLPGEAIVLAGGQVLNTGTITAPGGDVVVSAVEGGSLIRIEQAGLLLNLEVATLPNPSPSSLLPFSPTSLPDLLTGAGPVATASGVTVNPDGSVQLTGGPAVVTSPGTVMTTGTIDVSDIQGGQVLIGGRNVALPAGFIDISGTSEGGNLAVYATSHLSLGTGINAAGGGHSLFDPPTFTIDAAEAATIVEALLGGSVTIEASEIITVDAAIDSSGQTNNNILTLRDENADGLLAINLNAPIILGFNQVLTGDGSLVNVAATGSLQNGVDVAAAGATVTLEAGLYQESGPVILTRDITLNGAGADLTILDGTNEFRVLEVADSVTASLSNLTLANGNVDSFTTPLGGGGLLNFGILTLSNSIVRDNISDNGGGGIRNDGVMTLNNVIVQDNLTTNAFGGGIDNVFGANLTVNNSAILNNLSAVNGGGIASSAEATVTVNNTEITGNTAEFVGGGLYLDDTATATIVNSIISNNLANYDGGGIGSDGTLTLTGSVISGNIADFGGAVSNSGSATIVNSVISDNLASDGGGVSNDGALTLTGSIVSSNVADFGGGISNSGNAAIANSTISNNLASYDGGGIENSGNLTISNSLISGNIADFLGGGIDNFGGGNLEIDASTIRDNSAEFGGGIENLSDLVITNSTISGNTADFGGGIDNEANLDVRTSTISGNTATYGGGIENVGGNLTIVNSTISGNTATSEGGGIDNLNGGIVFIASSLVSGNTAPDGANLFNSAIFTSDGNNLFGDSGNDGITGATLVASDIVPLVSLDQILDPVLADNGGSTQTLALVDGSPAIDGGSGSDADQRGVAVVNGIRDIGAFEFEGVPPVPPGGPGGPGTPTPVDVPPEFEPDTFDCSGPCDDFANGLDSDSGFEADGSEDISLEPPFWEPAEEIAYEEWAAGDQAFTEDFINYFGLTRVSEPDIAASQRILRSRSNAVGTPPALIYVRFTPAGASAIAQAPGLKQTQPVIPQPTDILELILITPQGQPQRFVVPEATRDQVIASVQQLQIELTDRTRRRRTTYLQHAQQLYRWMMVPLEAALEQEAIGHLSFIMAPGLRSLPLATLHTGERFIIEDYTVGLMPSLALTDTRYTDIRQAAVLAMGASEFTDQPNLPAVPLELSTIVNQLRQGEQSLNQAFTPQTLITRRQSSAYSILHLATHGVFQAGGPSNSYIQFWNQRLSLDKIRQLQLNTPPLELLVMSACRTALGDTTAELGFAGLAVQAGVKSALATLWQVSDLETAGLMAEFYSQLNQRPYKAEALRQAQLAMLKGEVTVTDGALVWSGGSQPLPPQLAELRFGDTRHPYYWAAFTLVGSPW